MGQYFKAINLDKQEYLCPWCLCGGAKLIEWSLNPYGSVFPYLLRQSDCTGGGDLGGPVSQTIDLDAGDSISDLIAKTMTQEGKPMSLPSSAMAGRWAGDRIAMVGDYDSSGLYTVASNTYQNISGPLAEEYNRFMDVDEWKVQYDCCGSCRERESSE
ncbi:hypothetical protein [Thalassoglobus sp.]|uniref:hypothetical protein n=1 Tax=Thalassoglobus sp. TaxID=2795869 RepID=UPI003AA910E0